MRLDNNQPATEGQMYNVIVTSSKAVTESGEMVRFKSSCNRFQWSFIFDS